MMNQQQRNTILLLAFCWLPLFNSCQTEATNENSAEDRNTPVQAEPVPERPDDGMISIDTESWESYSNNSFGISLEKPGDWRLVESRDVPDDGIAINIFPANADVRKDLPLDLHADADISFISIFPKGLGTEYPSGTLINYGEAPSGKPQPGFAVDPEKSKVFLLKDGDPWAYFLVMETPAANWTDLGFVFAQLGVDNFQAACYDKSTGKAKPLDSCMPVEGDRFVRKGDIREREAAVIREIIKSIRISDGSVQKRINELIRVDRPQPNRDITSPYTVRGEAVGYWYFEGSFPVRLYDSKDRLLVETYAQADGEWMTKDFVPFTATLEFDAPDDERGKLVLERANPSGLKKNERQFSFPVIFPPKN